MKTFYPIVKHGWAVGRKNLAYLNWPTRLKISQSRAFLEENKWNFLGASPPCLHQGSALDPLGGSQHPPDPQLHWVSDLRLSSSLCKLFHVFSLIALSCLIVPFVVCGMEANLLYFVTPLKKKAIFFKRFYDFFMISYMKSFNSLKSKKGY